MWINQNLTRMISKYFAFFILQKMFVTNILNYIL